MEASLIQWLQAEFPTSAGWGFRDDAAQLHAPNSVITTDLLLEGVHFLAEADLERVGYKALAVNLSDLAAMAARPQGAVCSIALPRQRGMQTAQQLYRGMAPLLERFQCELVGGDTNVWEGPLAINLAVWGEPVGRPLRRTGGEPGDRLLVTGSLGGSLLGHHLDFCPRVAESLALMREFEIHAGMDLTDGLALDLAKLATASGCGAVIDLRHVPVSAAAAIQANTEGGTPLEHAMYDGEDFELLLAMPGSSAKQLMKRQQEFPELSGLTLTDIGELTKSLELVALDEAGALIPLEVRGYEHG